MNSNRIRSGVRAVLEKPTSRPLRLGVMRFEAEQDFRFVRRVSKEVGFRYLGDGGESEFRASADRTTLFILGSGSSVELIDDKGFEKIRGGLSIGINAWPLHTFVPDAYAYEPVDDERSDHFHTLSMLDRPDVLERSPAVFILRPRNQLEKSQLSQIPIELAERTFLYGRLTPATRKSKNLSGDLFQFFRNDRRRSALTVLLDSGATIVRLASLGLLLGYKKIVFVGVDLNNSRYFWEENPAYLSSRGIKAFDSGQKQAIHETMSPVNRPFVVTDILRSLSLVGERLFDTEFLVASETSALSEFLPTYSFDY